MKLPEGFSFVGDPENDRCKTPIYHTRPGDRIAKFSGYWWHDEPLEHAIKRGYAAWIEPGTYLVR
jgi:hypothetical protein